MVGSMAWGLRSSSSSLMVSVGAFSFIAFAFWAFFHGQPALIYAAAALFALVSLYSLDKGLGIAAALTYLLLLGDIRRVVGWIFGFPANDPLIAVGTVFALLVALPILMRPKLTGLTEKLMLALMGVMTLQIFNPAQGGLIVGIIGALYSFPPMLWFWIGKSVGSEAMMTRVIYRVVIPIAVLASILGFYQVFLGSPIWQAAWVDHVAKTYAALHLGGSIRAFGFSSSSSEYNNFLMIAAACCVVGVIAGRTALLFPLGVLIPAIVLGSVRGVAFRLFLAIVIAITFKNRGRAPLTIRFAFILVTVTIVAGFVLGQLESFTTTKPGTSGVDQALSHEIGGLAHPLDTKYSTAVGHSYQIMWGFQNAFHYPIGFGIGSTNIASSRGENSESTGGSEFEISDAFISLGLPGGMLYLALVVSILRDTVRYTTEGSRMLSLTMVSLMFGLFGGWLFPGEYATGPIIWFLVGCMRHSQDKRQMTLNREARDAAEATQTSRPALVPAT